MHKPMCSMNVFYVKGNVAILGGDLVLYTAAVQDHPAQGL
jgi:hypothetical protein